MSPFMSIAEMQKFVDVRLLNELISDTNSDGDYTTDSTGVLASSIERASEEIASAATRSNAYTVTELETLATANNGMLLGLTADLALCFLFERRGGTVPETVKAKANRAQERLGDLRDGKRVFAVDTKRDSGTATVQVITAATRGSLVMNADGSFFPTRRTQAY
jgi:hypothetical protein